MSKCLYGIRAFPKEAGAIRRLAQVSPGVIFLAIRCSVYLNLFLNLTEEGYSAVEAFPAPQFTQRGSR
jgi:hypothetical protein